MTILDAGVCLSELKRKARSSDERSGCSRNGADENIYAVSGNLHMTTIILLKNK